MNATEARKLMLGLDSISPQTDEAIKHIRKEAVAGKSSTHFYRSIYLDSTIQHLFSLGYDMEVKKDIVYVGW